MSNQSAVQALNLWVDHLVDDDAADALLGDRNRPTTADIAGRIACHYRALRRAVFQEAVFPVGLMGTQGAQAIQGDPQARAIRPDVSFVTYDRWRNNVEVDNQIDRSRSHRERHLHALRTLFRHGLNGFAECMIGRTQSTFVVVDGRRRVTHIKRWRYRVFRTPGTGVPHILPYSPTDQARGGALPRALPIGMVLGRNLLDAPFPSSVPPPPKCGRRR